MGFARYPTRGPRNDARCEMALCDSVFGSLCNCRDIVWVVGSRVSYDPARGSKDPKGISECLPGNQKPDDGHGNDIDGNHIVVVGVDGNGYVGYHYQSDGDKRRNGISNSNGNFDWHDSDGCYYCDELCGNSHYRKYHSVICDQSNKGDGGVVMDPRFNVYFLSNTVSGNEYKHGRLYGDVGVFGQQFGGRRKTFFSHVARLARDNVCHFLYRVFEGWRVWLFKQ